MAVPQPIPTAAPAVSTSQVSPNLSLTVLHQWVTRGRNCAMVKYVCEPSVTFVMGCFIPAETSGLRAAVHWWTRSIQLNLNQFTNSDERWQWCNVKLWHHGQYNSSGLFLGLLCDISGPVTFSGISVCIISLVVFSLVILNLKKYR